MKSRQHAKKIGIAAVDAAADLGAEDARVLRNINNVNTIWFILSSCF